MSETNYDSTELETDVVADEYGTDADDVAVTEYTT